ncbi:O-antigen ligase family protein [Vibrio sp. YMD68]|uniref:O-antigen ligase family protein n=1 Tax=Vibrio sp. YMD68 TaxID=3042300 RepID=UPI00249B860C|nr:O-antigen ligase family protein [Vibrio sp. YMD68]WGV98433.1 O-antigen ligase family protein [Vibrio sp. YMD68]
MKVNINGPIDRSLSLEKGIIKYDVLITNIIIFSLISASLISSAAAFIFLLSGLFHCVKRYQYSLAACKECWPLFSFSVVAIMSTFWSETPASSLKSALQIFCTTLICVSLIYTVKKEVIITALTVSLITLMLYGLSSNNTVIISYTGEVVRIGHFGSKNNMSSFAAFSAMVGIGTLCLPAVRPYMKVLGSFCTLLSIVVFYYAKSLGTNLAFFTVLFIALAIFFYSTKNISIINRRIINPLIVGYLIVFILSVIYFFNFSYYENFMYSLGKDPTITGRTMIWQVGFNSIQDNPLLGVGYGAYWNINNPGAIEIWELMHKEVGALFGFHNLYIHYYVELGVFGFLSIALIVGSCLKQAYLRATHGMELFDVFIFILLLFFFAKSFVETTGFAQFHFSHFSLCLIWMTLNRKTFFDCGKKTIIVFEGKA